MGIREIFKELEQGLASLVSRTVEESGWRDGWLRRGGVSTEREKKPRKLDWGAVNGRKWDASGGGVAKGPIDAARCWGKLWLEGSGSERQMYLCMTKHGQDLVCLSTGE